MATTPLIVQVIHWNWKWDNVTYEGAHGRSHRLWGSASQYPCVICGKPAREWAYDGTDLCQKVSPRGQVYSPYPEFYMPACGHCHKVMDRSKSVCKNGHEMEPSNIAFYPSEPRRRVCIKCSRAKSLRAQRKRRKGA